MLRKILNLLLLFVATALVGCRKDTDAGKATVVRVNNAELTAEVFAQRMATALKGISSLAARDQKMISETKARIIQEFVHATITSAWAKDNGVFVRKEDLDEEVRKVRSQYPDDVSFRAALMDAGFSYEQWLQQVQRNLLQQLVSLKIRADVEPPSQKEVEEYYKKNKSLFHSDPEMRISQIVLKDEESASRILAQLKKGESFEELAKKYSITPEGENGGDLGWISRGTNDIFDTTFRMGVGQLSRVVKSPFGYHILKPTGRRSARTKPLSEVSGSIERNLMAEREQRAYSSWLEKQLLKAKVYKNEPLIRSINIVTKME